MLLAAIAACAAGGETRVSAVYPSADRLPANLLKFYIHFSAPMSRGEAWQRIHLLDEQGVRVEMPFLEIEQELWDRRQERLTVLFDPGRIKRDVLPRQEVGAALEEGKRYTLVVDAAWRDANGRPLAAGHRKQFHVIAEDRTPIDPSHWRVQTPEPGTRDPLIVDVRESLDHALMERMLQVVGATGVAQALESECRWQFTPDQPWRPGAYLLRIDTALEDLAGNKVGRAFDVDVFEKVTRKIESSSVELPFRIGGK